MASRSPTSTRIRAPESYVRQRLHRLFLLSLEGGTAAAIMACHSASDAEPADASVADVESQAADGTAGEGSVDSADAAAPDACGSVIVDAAVFGDDGACANFVWLPCGIPSPALRGDQCFPSVDLCTKACPTGFFWACEYPPATCQEGGILPDADIYLECNTCPGNMGRRPVGDGLCVGVDGLPPVAGYFMAATRLEAASVHAFHQLRERLRGFGAPPRLARKAARAKRDERRHARLTSRLARLHGNSGRIRVSSPGLAALDLEAFAIENAVEGCVRETFAAVLALHQAERSPHEHLQGPLRRLAQDEVDHAALAWRVHGWALGKLPPDGRARVRQAQREALIQLRATVLGFSAEVAGEVGLPAPAKQAWLLDRMAVLLFGFGGDGRRICLADPP